MNIFATSPNPRTCAVVLDDRRLVKMVLETAQLLCTTVHCLNPLAAKNNPALYKPTHVNHPCAIWARQSQDNFTWLFQHGGALAAEYERRFAREHASLDVMKTCWWQLSSGVVFFDNNHSTPFTNCSGFNSDGSRSVHECYALCLEAKWCADRARAREELKPQLIPRWTRCQAPPTLLL